MLTELKAEGELGLFEALANTLPALVRICNSSGHSVWFNHEWLKFRGRTPEMEMGAGWLEGLHPKDIEENLGILSHRFALHEPYELKYRLRHHSGQYRWVLHRAAPRFNANGEFLGFVTACIDIHDATVADHERAQFFEVASDILIISDQQGSISRVSSACERVLGWTAGEMTEHLLADLLHPEDISSTMATADVLRRGEELNGFENRYRHKDGSYRWLSWRARRDAETGQVFGSAMDVTERKTYEAELEESVSRYNLAISATSDGIWDWNLETDQLYLSPRCVQILGLSEDDRMPKSGKEWRAFLHPDDIQTNTDLVNRYLSGDEPDYRTDFRIRHGDGGWRILQSKGVVLRDGNGKPLRMLGVHADVTEQRQLEENLRNLKDQAEAANKAKSDFLANMSHEIRTPMNAVIGAAQLLRMGPPLNEKQEKLVGVLNDSAKSMMELLNNFLDLHKIESGNFEFEQIEFDARQLVTDVIQLLDIQAQAKGLKFIQMNECACVNERLFIGDPVRIRQILTNLCSNAVKFTDAGSVSVKISCQQTPGLDTEELSFEICDTGIGIPPEKLKAIFGKFEQADATITRKFGGSGLGLAIVKTLLEAMNGTVSVISDPGLGSTFFVKIPLRRGTAQSIARISYEDIGFALREKPRILIVEDLPANVLIAQQFLDQFGFSYEVAFSGQEALNRLFSGETFDAILMDIQMPGMDGREACARIRQYERETGCAAHHIIAVTAHAFAADRDNCLAAGVDDYLSKPYDGRVLEQKLLRALAERRKTQSRFQMQIQVT